MNIVLDNGPIENLLLDEPLNLPAVAADEILAPVDAQEAHQFFQRFDGERAAPA